MAEMDKDMYGVDRQQAQGELDTFLHDTLEEPQAELAELYLEQGRWQAHVNNSQRGIRVVFLEQHNGKVVPGHMTVDSHPEAPLRNW